MNIWIRVKRGIISGILAISLFHQVSIAPMLLAQEDAAECTTDALYADKVIEFVPGTRANHDFGNPNDALGAPDLSTDPLGGFVHLGIGGSITLQFVDNLIVDGSGDDIRIWGDPFSDELFEVQVSADGETFVSFGLVPEIADLDLSDLEEDQVGSVQFIRFIDDSSTEQVSENIIIPGPELDAVEALHCEPVEVPDSDGDGVSDEDDFCPDFPGKPETNGC